MGTVFQIPWTWIGSDASQWPRPGLERLKELGFRTAALALDSRAISIEDPRLMACLLYTSSQSLGGALELILQIIAGQREDSSPLGETVALADVDAGDSARDLGSY